ncbi:MAG: hypothetical protein IKZ53_03335 [Selenomonadaceae bacterium]|nr:hypothetical protein [Selenomonadaceae bacterium]
MADGIKKEEIMSDEELDKVAGGITYWWQRVTGTWVDPATGRNYEDGYLVKGSDPAIGSKTDSLWISKEDWENWKAIEEWRGNTFIKGDANPQATK